MDIRTYTGHLTPGAPDYVYLPVSVPPGTSRIGVRYSYDRVPGNACDIGVFDERGTAVGFRGWSGGARDQFEIGPYEATPGYLPGPVGAGTWHVVLGPYTVAPGGMDYTVTVTLADEPVPAARPAVPGGFPPADTGRGPGWYRGDCHLHTVFSDGRRTPGEVAAAARARGLDFLGSSEHNTPASHPAWGAHAGPDLLVLTGEEITTRNGHCLAIGLPPGTWIDWRFRAADGVFDGIADQVREAGALLVPAHPYGTCVACSWKFGYARADAIEVWNGSWELTDEATLAMWDGLLVAGDRWIPAMGNSDAHAHDDVVGLPQTVVYADALSRTGILAGIAAGRSWIADDAGVGLTFEVSAGGTRAGIGERLAAGPDTPVTVALDVTGVPDGTVRLVTDRGTVHTAPADGPVRWTTTARYTNYVRAEVRHDDDVTPYGSMAAMTNPVFVDRADAVRAG
ncbi:CehA/McbA family metallohydrolase [Actinocatenispora rupis]|uniref:Phosphoesterase n=1 Tax=Actinocatenispora rupis TaxID=519421 RepID=A0A8J3J4G0_9ACTN|nr:CehA/McbA family metallohydrolase [Actinocatenispora rupis]GID14003.1 phosphoesterase [Actinocatenispora rupis]